MAELAEREVASWPREQPVKLHPRLQGLTLEIILRAVFGLEQGQRLDDLRDVLTEILAFAGNPLSVLPALTQHVRRIVAFAGRRQQQLDERADRLIFELVEERRAAAESNAHGDDVLAMLLGARHEDGSPMSDQEIRDELMTLAGGRPRDDRFPARVGVRAARARAAGDRPARGRSSTRAKATST